MKCDRKLATDLFRKAFSVEEIVDGNQSGQTSRSRKHQPEEKQPIKYDERKMDFIYTVFNGWLTFLVGNKLKVTISRSSRKLFAMYIRDAAAPIKKAARNEKKQ
jgi:hypothetical protein